MTRLSVPGSPATALDQVRQELARVEVDVANLRRSGSDPLQILVAMDRVSRQLEVLGGSGADVRAEQVRLDGVWQMLQRDALWFVRRVGPALRQERERRGAGAHGPWWWIDRTAAHQQRRRAGRALGVILTFSLFLLLGLTIYELFLAPPRPLRQAMRHLELGQEAWEAGDAAGALAEFEAAAALVPDHAATLLWLGVTRQELGDVEGAQAAYAAAREQFVGAREFLFERGLLFVDIGDLPAARADAEAVIELSPQWGYGFYLLAAVEAAEGRVEEAVAGYRRAAELAHEVEDDQLESAARVQIGLLLEVSQP